MRRRINPSLAVGQLGVVQQGRVLSQQFATHQVTSDLDILARRLGQILRSSQRGVSHGLGR
ncbi:MAG TPA: hypothetical protein VGS80_15980 [Ktedonobacterales bacterium]|nr:hypothetical protein [Ktedonobacterales bacterium]